MSKFREFYVSEGGYLCVWRDDAHTTVVFKLTEAQLQEWKEVESELNQILRKPQVLYYSHVGPIGDRTEAYEIELTDDFLKFVRPPLSDVNACQQPFAYAVRRLRERFNVSLFAGMTITKVLVDKGHLPSIEYKKVSTTDPFRTAEPSCYIR